MGSRFLPAVITGILATVLTCLSPHSGLSVPGKPGRSYRVLFYNTENLFDPFDDTLTADEDFTPSGRMHWTYKRYEAKLNNTYKVLVAAGAWQPPDIIGMCEVENRRTLEDLVNHTPFSKYTYRIVHENSADRRGIDVALLYNPLTVQFISSHSFRIKKRGLLTRDILYCKVRLGSDTCHVLVNHWPSRSEGQLETEPDRLVAAGMLRFITDSLFNRAARARIIIMGDFNDEPSDESLTGRLKATRVVKNALPAGLYNLTSVPSSGPVKGTLKYQGEWNTFDQIIVSGSLLSSGNGLKVSEEGYRIFSGSFLLATDKKYEGYKPFRTYNGYAYLGGFSDHLPVYIDLTDR
jgi:endonuclease/exonuclease/phosphatase family metal-dependent hydrolase